MRIKEPKFRAVISVTTADGTNSNFVYNDDKPKELMDQFKALLGDCNATVHVSADWGVKSFGNGASATVSVSLTCNQDQATMIQAAELGASFTRFFVKKFQGEGEAELRQKLLSEGRKAEF